MKWFSLILAGFFALGSTIQLFTLASHFHDIARSYKEESWDKTASPERAKHAEVLGQLYSTAATSIFPVGGFACAIINLIGFAAIHSQQSEARIRVMEEELKQLRSLLAGAGQPGN